MIQWLFKFYFEFNDATSAGVLGFRSNAIEAQWEKMSTLW